MGNVVASFHAHDIHVSREAIDAALIEAIERIGARLAIDGLPADEASALDAVGAIAATADEVSRQTLGTTARYAALLAGALRTAEVAALLGVSDGRVRQKLRDRALYAIDDPAGRGHLFPRFQFDGGRPLPGLGEVLTALPDGVHPLAVESFFLEESPDLDPDLDGDDGPAPVAEPAAAADLARAREMLERAGYATVAPGEGQGGRAALGAGGISPRRWLASGGSPAAVAALAAGL